MNGTSYIAASAALDHQRRLEVIANNLANVNTAGFKADGLAFQLDATNTGRIGAQTREGDAPTVGPRDAGRNGADSRVLLGYDNMPATMKLTGYTDFSEGPSRHTGNPLDVALEGDGFFSVRTPSGVSYTRQGSFSLNPDSVLVTSDGYPVMGDGGEITIEGQSVAIDEEGYITVDGNEVGKLQIVSFADPNKLEKVRGTLFKPSASGPAPQPVENTVVKQGYLENSNVNAIRMMTDMITEMRMVEAYQRMIRSSDSANTKAINELGRIV